MRSDFKRSYKKQGVDGLETFNPLFSETVILYAYGLPNFAASIATLVFTPVIFAVYLPSSHRKVYSKGNLTPLTSR